MEKGTIIYIIIIAICILLILLAIGIYIYKSHQHQTTNLTPLTPGTTPTPGPPGPSPPGPPSPNPPGPPPLVHCIIPDGPWQNTCANGTMDGNILHASCVNHMGTSVDSSLNLLTCAPGGVRNSNGQLLCVNPGTGLCQSQTCVAPAGGYERSCDNIVVNGTILSANCRIGGGPAQPLTLDLSRCGQGYVSIQNGQLVCGKGLGLC